MTASPGTTTLRHGTILVERDGRWCERRDRAGALQTELSWRGDALARLTVWGHRGDAVMVDGARVAHPVLGEAHPITTGDHAPLAVMSAVRWAAPTTIPAIDRPAALPPGTGAMLLDAIARLAASAGVAALRYAGPYPTAALWQSLGASFTRGGDEAAFTADAATRWRGGALPPLPIDFGPAPHERIDRGHGVIAVLRDGLERAVIDGASFEPGASVRRLMPVDDGWRAALVFGDAPWAEVARLSVDGEVRSRTASPVVDDAAPAGAVLPAPLVAALLELIADALPAPLSADALATVPIVWGDAGLAAAADRGDRVILHVGLWHSLAPHGLARLALALAEALTPIARHRAIAALAHTLDGGGG